MTTFLTCRSCARRDSCEIQDRLHAAIKGLHVTTVRHTCKEHALPFEKGQAVWAYVMCHPFEDEWDKPGMGWFPGHFVDVSSRSNTRGLVYVAEGARCRDNSAYEFIPARSNSDGAVCKLPWKRIEAREAPAVSVCSRCFQLDGMKCEGSDYGPCPRKQAVA